jgi:hypothetical protein
MSLSPSFARSKQLSTNAPDADHDSAKHKTSYPYNSVNNRASRSLNIGLNIIEIRRQMLQKSLEPLPKTKYYQKMHDAYQEKIIKIEKSWHEQQSNLEQYSFEPHIDRNSKLLATLVGKDIHERNRKFELYYAFKQGKLEKEIKKREDDKIALSMERTILPTEKRNILTKSKVKQFIAIQFPSNGFKNTPIKPKFNDHRLQKELYNTSREAPKKTYLELGQTTIERSKSPHRKT